MYGILSLSNYSSLTFEPVGLIFWGRNFLLIPLYWQPFHRLIPLLFRRFHVCFYWAILRLPERIRQLPQPLMEGFYWFNSFCLVFAYIRNLCIISLKSIRSFTDTEIMLRWEVDIFHPYMWPSVLTGSCRGKGLRAYC